MQCIDLKIIEMGTKQKMTHTHIYYYIQNDEFTMIWQFRFEGRTLLTLFAFV